MAPGEIPASLLATGRGIASAVWLLVTTCWWSGCSAGVSPLIISKEVKSEAYAMDAKNLAVLMQLKNAMEMASPSPIPTPHVEPEPPQSKTGWLVRPCRFCKTSKVSYRADWVNPPVMCQGCRNERKTRYVPGQGDTLYAKTQVFHGGSPGGGRSK